MSVLLLATATHGCGRWAIDEGIAGFLMWRVTCRVLKLFQVRIVLKSCAIWRFTCVSIPTTGPMVNRPATANQELQFWLTRNAIVRE